MTAKDQQLFSNFQKHVETSMEKFGVKKVSDIVMLVYRGKTDNEIDKYMTAKYGFQNYDRWQDRIAGCRFWNTYSAWLDRTREEVEEARHLI